MFLFNLSITVVLATVVIHNTLAEFCCFYKCITYVPPALVITAALKIPVIVLARAAEGADAS